MGIGAKKTLRSLYERLVTAGYIAKNPAEGAHSSLRIRNIAKGKVLNRAIEAVPELVKKDFHPEEIQNLRDRKKESGPR